MKTLRVKTKGFLKKLPNAPSVYLFKNKKGEIIYVGRASSLKSRVSSYFATGSEGSRTCLAGSPRCEAGRQALGEEGDGVYVEFFSFVGYVYFVSN